MYTIKNFKSFKGHEGEPCGQGTLHGSSGKVADWSDDSWGGCMHVHFTSPAAENAFVEFAKTYLADKKDFAGEPYDIPEMHSSNLVETAIFAMSVAFMEEKEELKQAKKGIAYYRPDPAKPGDKLMYVTTAPYTPENVAKLRGTFPDLVEIINERLGLPFVDAGQHLIAQQNKRYKALCKTVTLYSMRDGKGDLKVMQMKVPYSATIADMLRKTKPTLVEIINERYL